MFILFGKQNGGNHKYVLGVFKDKAKLQAMIDQYDNAPISSSGKNRAFEDCPEEFVFGDFLLKKAKNLSFACDEFCIYWDDYLMIEETRVF